MRTLQERFGALREALATQPSRQTWAQLCHVVEDAAALDMMRVREEWFPYLEGALRRWPDDLRVCPQRWLEADRDPLSLLTRVVWSPHGPARQQTDRLAALWRHQPALKAHMFGVRLPAWGRLPDAQVVVHAPADQLPRSTFARWAARVTDPLHDHTTLRRPVCSNAQWSAIRPYLPLWAVERFGGNTAGEVLLITHEMPHLHSLSLAGAVLDADWALTLPPPRKGKGLQTLDLSDCMEDDPPTRLPPDTGLRLHTLILDDVFADELDLTTLFASPMCASLHTLRAQYTLAPAAANAMARAIASAPYLGESSALRRVDLRGAALTPDTLEALRQAGIPRRGVALLLDP